MPDAENPLAPCIMGVAPESLRSRNSIDQFMEKSKRFSELIDPSRYDIVHCHGQYGYHIALRWARLVRRPPLISGFHLTALGPIERYKELGLGEPDEAPIDRAVAFMEHAMGYFSDHCIAVSRGVASEVVKFYDVPGDRVQVIANWYDPRIFQEFDSQTARGLLNLKAAARYLLYVGHFNMSRGKIMAAALRRLPNDITLLVAHHEEDEAIVAEFGDRVRFTGHCTPQTLALYYAAADLLCFPSLYGGFGLVLVEAMACGCAPVVFDYAAMNELVTEDSGYLVVEPTAEAYSSVVERALSDGRKKAPAARRRAQAFQMDLQIEAVVDLYCRLLRKASRSSASAALPNQRGSSVYIHQGK